MVMAPTSSLSLSIGTTICERAPASCADSGLLSSEVASTLWTSCLVRNMRPRGFPGGGVNGLCSRASTSAGGAPTMVRDERVTAMAEQHAKLGLTDAKCIVHHRTEHRLQ